MQLFRCDNCELLTSEEFYVCPKCNSEKTKLKVETYSIEDDIYTLTMDDYEFVLNHYYSDGAIKYVNENFSQETIKNILQRKLEIEYDEYIRAVIDCRLLENYNE